MPHVGDLDHVDQKGLGLPLRQHLGIQRTGLQSDVAGLDFGEQLVEGGQQLDLTLLRVGRVEREGTFGLGLRHVGAGLEAFHLLGLGAELGPAGSLGVGRRSSGKGNSAQSRGRGSEQLHCFLRLALNCSERNGRCPEVQSPC
jgi:hypothetical protein